MDATAVSILKRFRADFPFYAKSCLRIRSKSGEIWPFELNDAQMYIHKCVEQQRLATGKVRAIILKGRQQGCSTYVEGRFFWRVTNNFGLRAFILTHDTQATNNLFEMAQRFFEYCPPVVRPAVDTSNAKELVFGKLDSGYKIGTAGNKAVGRSSTIQLLHSSEAAYQANAAEHAKGIMQAVPNEPETEIFFESTANGIGNYFHEQWQLAETGDSQFMPIFIPWYWQKEYAVEPEPGFKLTDEEEQLEQSYKLTLPQLAWRRVKISELSVGGSNGSKAFVQEYPCNAAEAFQHSGEDNFIIPDFVMKARKCITEGIGPLVVGVDPARFGDDRTSIIFRRGRCAYNLVSYSKKDTMEVAGLVHRLIIDHSPDKVCIDIGGLGAGVYDRLLELGHQGIIVAVNSGQSPLDQNKYINKRAEMWGLMREWLAEVPVQVPDEDTLHTDLCGIKYKFDSNSRLVMEKKEDMKRRGLRSPDSGDALALTFALPDNAVREVMRKRNEKIAQNIMGTSHHIDRLRKKAYI